VDLPRSGRPQLPAAEDSREGPAGNAQPVGPSAVLTGLIYQALAEIEQDGMDGGQDHPLVGLVWFGKPADWYEPKIVICGVHRQDRWSVGAVIARIIGALTLGFAW
jgi:hypothetical protein